jgi:hypothetical protein
MPKDSITIATHNGSAVRQSHNRRDLKVVTKEEHIDLSRVHENWIDEPIRVAYHRLFDDAVRRYNASQTREDRKIKDYYKKMLNDAKQHPCYEMIIGIYSKQKDGTSFVSEEQGKEILKEFVDNWKERNPNLELIGAYYHADEEGEPHVHIDYIPVAHGYNRGMDTQAGLVKALGEMGFTKEGRATAQIQWEKRENDYLTTLCERRGIKISHPKKEGKEHLDTETYKAKATLERSKDLVTKQMNQKLRLEDSIYSLEKKKDSLEKEIEALEKKSLRKVKTDKYDWYQEFIAREYNLPPNKIDTDPRFRFNKFEKSYAEYLDTLLAEEIPRERGQSRF